MNAAQYRALLDASIASLEALVRAVLAREGVPVTNEQRSAAALQLLRPVQQARQETYNVAQRHVQLTAGSTLDIAPEPPEYGLGAPIELMQRVVEQQGVTEATRRDPLVARKGARAISRGLTRHAEQPAREVVVAAAERGEGAWQRILTGERSCYFCAMLASRGPIYTTRQEALTGKGTGESIRDGELVYVYHDGCDCIVTFIPKGAKDWEGRAEWKRLEHMWRQADNAEDDDRPTAKVFRSYWEKQVREGKTARYIPDSIAPTPELAVELDVDDDRPDIPDRGTNLDVDLLDSEAEAQADADGEFAELSAPAAPETKLDRALRELNEAIESGDDERIAAAADEADRLEDERARRAERREQQQRDQADRIGALIEDGTDPAEAEAEVTGKSVEFIRRRDFMAQARSEGHVGESFDKLITSLHMKMAEELYFQAEAATNGVMVKRQYVLTFDPRTLWWVNDATARKYMSEEMAAWFDQHGRLTRPVLRDMVLSGSYARSPLGEDFLQ